MSRASQKAAARKKKRSVTSKISKRRKVRGKYKTQKAKKKAKSRNYDRQYLQMIANVRLRDSYCCQICGLKSVKLQAHHIRRWADSPSLRKKEINLISLCKKCHDNIRNREDQFKGLLYRKAKHNTREYRRLKWTYEDLLKKDAANQLLPDDFIPFEYKSGDELKVKKAKEHYLSKLYRGIKSRCYNPNNKSYKRYGGRGIKLFKGWKEDRDAFLEWIQTNLGDRPLNHSLDRIDNDGDYAPGNVKWSSDREQAQNRSTTSIDDYVVIVSFILYHKYKKKQSEIMYMMNMSNQTVIRNVVKFKTFKQLTASYKKIVKEQAVIDEIEKYEKEIKDIDEQQKLI